MSRFKLVPWILIIILLASSVFAIKTFYVQETDIVKVTAEAIDPDNDNVQYQYSSPLDENGEWQTTYDDEGEHELEITASDGDKQSTKKIKVVVANKNRPPVLTDKKIVMKETQLVDLKQVITDPDHDPLSYVFKLPFNSKGQWQTGYGNEGNFVTEFKVDDGEFEETFRVEIDILKTNQPPTIKMSFSEDEIVKVEEDEILKFYVDVVDQDEDEMNYFWQMDGDVIGKESYGEFYFDYESAGKHSLSLTVSDGQSEIVKEWEMRVDNVNRKPELVLLPITVNEVEKVVLDLPDVDSDQETLSYSFESPLDENGEWLTDHDDAGTYNLEIIVSDGELTTKTSVDITVLETDRAPVLNLPKRLEVRENSFLLWEVDTFDLDDDKVKVTFENLPSGAVFNQKSKTFSWEPGFDAIKRKGGFFSNILNTLRLEHFFLKKKIIPLGVTSCGKDLCESGTLDLIVYNSNRVPSFEKVEDIFVKETQLAQLNVDTIDEDGDFVRIYYTSPLGKKSGQWATDYDDEGIYPVYVTATDGKLGVTEKVNIHVTKNNRLPTLKIRNDDLVVNEGQEFMFEVSASDPDGDDLNISLANIPPGASFKDGTFIWKPGFDVVMNRSEDSDNDFVSNFAYLNKKFNNEQETVWLEFVVSDGEFEVNHPVKVTVKNVNQAPEIVDYLPLQETTVKINEPMIFHAVIQDFDNDKLDYVWSFGFNQDKVKGPLAVSRTFTSPGKKKVKLVVSDGRKEIEHQWLVNVIGKSKKVVKKSSQPEPKPSAPVSTSAPDVVPEEPFTVKVYVIEG
jgi:hypothetical protein